MTCEPHSNVTLKRLVKRAQRGDAAAFEELCRPCSATLYRVAASCLGGNEADVADALQNTLMAAWRAIGSLQQPRYFKTWLVRICINSCRQLQRKQRPSVPLEDVSEGALDTALRSAGRVDDATRAAAEAEADDAFRQLVQAAGESCALVITLYYGEGYSTDEIADLLSLTPEAVRQRLFRGRKRIARALGESAEPEQPGDDPAPCNAAGQPGRPRAPSEEDGLLKAATPA